MGQLKQIKNFYLLHVHLKIHKQFTRLDTGTSQYISKQVAHGSHRSLEKQFRCKKKIIFA